MDPLYEELWRCYKQAIDTPVISFFIDGNVASIPTLNEVSMSRFLEDAMKIVQEDPMVMRLTGPIVIVGDLHGHILDLFRIFHTHGYPDKTKYLFLGDIVDRGEFSLETLTLVLLTKILFPQNVFIIRGNHEFQPMCEQFGFKEEVNERYKSYMLFNQFNMVFNYLPLAAVVNGDLLCIHGGIGPNFFTLKQIESIERPLATFVSPVETSILWSDPCTEISDFAPSTRGIGNLFGENATSAFLKESGMRAIIRGHECVAKGVDTKFENCVITVFSASNYCGISGNSSGVIEVNACGAIIPKISPPIPYLLRSKVKFVTVKKLIGTTKSAPLVKECKLPKSKTKIMNNRKENMTSTLNSRSVMKICRAKTVDIFPKVVV